MIVMDDDTVRRLPEACASPEELDERVARLRRMMHDQGLDAVVIVEPRAVFWFTAIWLGWFKSAPAIVVTQDGHKVVARLLDRGWEDVWAFRSWANDWTYHRDEDDVPARVGEELLALAGPGCRVGMELRTNDVPPRYSNAVREHGVAVECVDVSVDVADLRAVKSPRELELIRRAGRITGQGMDEARERIARGETDASAAAAAFSRMVDEGSGMFFVGPLVAAGPVNRGVHVPWANTRPRDGEPVTAMMCAIVAGYGCPLERTFFKNDVPPNARRKLQSVSDAVDHAMARLRPGMTGAEVHSLLYEAHEANELGHEFLHRGGYSVGINWSDLSLLQIMPGEDRRLREGMTFHLVPHLMDEELGLLCASQPVLVTSSGAEKLVEYPLILDPV